MVELEGLRRRVDGDYCPFDVVDAVRSLALTSCQDEYEARNDNAFYLLTHRRGRCYQFTRAGLKQHFMNA